MVSLRTSALLLATLHSLGCQRVPDDNGPAASAGEGDTAGDPAAGTFLPQTGDDGAADETGDEGGDNGCNAVAQIGCNDGQRCTATSLSGGVAVYGCVADTGSLEPFDTCEQLGGGVDDCPAGYACIANFASEGACLPLCNDSKDCELGVCALSKEESIPYCADDCSPFDSLCVAPTQCRRNGERFSCRIPAETDVGGAGQPCVQLDDGGCTTSLVCTAGALVPDCSEQNCCTPLCELGAADPCPSPSTCNLALSAPAPGFETIGSCFVPS